MNLQECKLCDNFIKRQLAVKGIGNINANIIFIFDHPRYKEDKTGLFRSNDNINIFLGYLSNIGFNEFNAYYTFLVKCRPTNNYNYVKAMTVCSTNHLSREYMVHGVKKKIIIAVGKTVANYILGGILFKNFHVYENISMIIPIPDVEWFIKGGELNLNRLKNIKPFYDANK